MKKILSILGTISLITSGSSNLIACNNTPTLTSEELAELKEKNSKIINGNKLEWIAPQEKPFDTVDNKWYVVIWRGNSSDNWRIAKFDNNKNYRFSDSIDDRQIDIDTNNNKLWLYKNSLRINDGFYWGLAPIVLVWEKNKIKYVYRWDGQNELPVLKINSNGEIEN